jgi:hypothetical protein
MLLKTYHFEMFTTNGGAQVDGIGAGRAFTMEIWDVMANPSQVAFEFYWDTTSFGSITQVNWDDDAALLDGISSISNTGTMFSEQAGNFNVPAGNTIDFGDGNPLRANFGVDSDPPVSPNGILQVGDLLRVVFNLEMGVSVDDVVAALNLGASDNTTNGQGMRVAAHVQSMGPDGEFSNSFVLVPLPASAWAGIASLAGVFGAGYLRRRSFRG